MSLSRRIIASHPIPLAEHPPRGRVQTSIAGPAVSRSGARCRARSALRAAERATRSGGPGPDVGVGHDDLLAHVVGHPSPHTAIMPLRLRKPRFGYRGDWI